MSHSVTSHSTKDLKSETESNMENVLFNRPFCVCVCVGGVSEEGPRCDQGGQQVSWPEAAAHLLHRQLSEEQAGADQDPATDHYHTEVHHHTSVTQRYHHHHHTSISQRYCVIMCTV